MVLARFIEPLYQPQTRISVAFHRSPSIEYGIELDIYLHSRVINFASVKEYYARALK